MERNLEAELGALDDPRSIRRPPRTVLATRRHYVVFEGSPVILRYEEDGSYAGTVGERGQGPGEITLPMSLLTDSTDTLWVAEYGGRVTLFTPDGDPVRTVSDGWPNYPQLQAFTPSGRPVVQRLPREGSRLEVLERGGGVHSRIAHAEPDTAGLSTITLIYPRGVLPLSESDFLVRTTRGDALLRLRVDGPSDTILTRAELEEALSQVADRLAPDSLSGISEMVLGENRTIWGLSSVRIADPEEINPIPPGMTEAPTPSVGQRNRMRSTLIWHADLESRTVSALPPLDEAYAGFIDASRHYTVHEDSLGLLTLRIWRIRRVCSG